ncbi:hypothetical protein HYC85_005514 [Camellia sinensis]|uniref:Uncharacterized protein n=1 Tax=Camellia sinensis TaxID=4442 RepID=A0A7J7I047_CAMSI|nr:hypothetical protein HYC85_005514 [Camellia sinensis]
MKLASLNPRIDFNIDSFFMKELPAYVTSFPAAAAPSGMANLAYLQFIQAQQVPQAAQTTTSSSMPAPNCLMHYFSLQQDQTQPISTWGTDLHTLRNAEFQLCLREYIWFCRHQSWIATDFQYINQQVFFKNFNITCFHCSPFCSSLLPPILHIYMSICIYCGNICNNMNVCKNSLVSCKPLCDYHRLCVKFVIACKGRRGPHPKCH